MHRRVLAGLLVLLGGCGGVFWWLHRTSALSRPTTAQGAVTRVAAARSVVTGIEGAAPDAYRVSGTVVDEAGVAIAQATIRVASDDLLTEPQQLQSDTHGRFTVAQLRGRELQLVAMAEGYEGARATVAMPTVHEVRL